MSNLCVLIADLNRGVQSLLSMMQDASWPKWGEDKKPKSEKLMYCCKFAVLTAFDNNGIFVHHQVMLVVNRLKTNIFFRECTLKILSPKHVQPKVH